MESVGGGVGRFGVDLADDAVAAGGQGARDHRLIERAPEPPFARGRRDGDAIDVDEAGEALAEPEKVRARIIGGFVESDQERICISGDERNKRLVEEVLKFRVPKPASTPRRWRC